MLRLVSVELVILFAAEKQRVSLFGLTLCSFTSQIESD